MTNSKIEIPNDIQGTWIRSTEEDTDDKIVFRRPDYLFPPSRGRSGISFSADKSFKQSSPGPTDVSKITEGTWQADETAEDRITITQDGVSDVLEVESVEEDRLIVKRPRSAQE